MPGFLHVEASWTFPCEEVPPLPDAADMERRVKREEILHTGKLRLKIVKAGMGWATNDVTWGWGMVLLDPVGCWMRSPSWCLAGNDCCIANWNMANAIEIVSFPIDGDFPWRC